MAKKRTIYECLACGYESPKWLGRCPNCGAWNQMEEQIVLPPASQSPVQVQTDRSQESLGAQKLKDISASREERMTTHSQECDRVLGGGLVTGSLVLLGGDPGIGKSTLLLQVSMALSESDQKVLYVSGEESLAQIKLRSDRLDKVDKDLYLMADTDLGRIAGEIQRLSPNVVVIDSIQTMQSPDNTGMIGSVSQVRQVTAALMRIAKDNQIAIFIVGHVTKEGNIAGPRILEHMVDTVLYFEGEEFNRFRILRAVKNRFGSTNEIGVFEMQDDGLHEVTNPSQLFLEERRPGAIGSTVVPALEGTRIMMAEIQSLMTPTVYGNARRTSSGLDYQRVNLMLAVMEKHCGILAQNQDASFKTTGGVKLSEPAIDLALAMSIASSYREKPIDVGTCFIGEIGLTGEIRRVTQVASRIREAHKLGFKRVVLPRNNYDSLKEVVDIELLPISTIQEVHRLMFA